MTIYNIGERRLRFKAQAAQKQDAERVQHENCKAPVRRNNGFIKYNSMALLALIGIFISLESIFTMPSALRR